MEKYEKKSQGSHNLFLDNSLLVFSSKMKFHFLLLSIFLIAGLLVGSIAASSMKTEDGKIFIPLFFSGIPTIGSSFFSSFSTLLLNTIIHLILLFLAGTTAFGFLAIPVIVLFKGLSIGVAAVSFLANGSHGLIESSFVYMPAMAFISLIVVLFALQALLFSTSFSKSFFSAGKVEIPDFTEYLKNFFLFLFFSVIACFIGAGFTMLYPLIFV
ncbi:stage II sporulation protein M [Scatolibacter rhodanostii]|uniref:stage II sporulation protein M n=1 Tax=Scatolibacter rhodanostii TaxID=2014781 RepID=UPI000C085C7D|nr:stage II sporulation protein M [Scatolibacter rhodanostii]